MAGISGIDPASGAWAPTMAPAGLQENEADFGGAASFKDYGEVLDPELSNLAIFTVGLGLRPSEKFSLDRLDGKAVLGYFFKACSGKGLRVVVPGEAT